MVWATALLLSAALVLGGGTRAGFGGDVALQILALPLLGVALWRAAERRPWISYGGVGALLVVAVLQLLPLSLGASGFAALANEGLALAGQTGAWGPASLTPHATAAALVSVLPALAIFTSAALLDQRQRLMLAWVVLGWGVVGLALGFLQVAQGPNSALRVFEITNPTEAVGFFANRNHFAALLCIVLVLGAVWFAATIDRARPERRAGRPASQSALLWVCLAIALLVAVVAGLALARSRAGIILGMIALVGIVTMFAVDRRRQGRATADRAGGRGAVVATLVVAVLFAAQFGMGRILTRLTGDPFEDLRIPLAITTFEATLSNLPLGTGLGSFVPVYAALENPADTLVAYANRAHNDLLELPLELGLAGALLLVLFVGWLLVKSVMPARTSGRPACPSDERLIAAGAVLVLWVLLLHSLVDYPLRTTALSAVFALACAWLLAPGSGEERGLAESPFDERAAVPSTREVATVQTYAPSARPAPAVRDAPDWTKAWQDAARAKERGPND